MATMVKEKRREKKKSKERSSASRELSPVAIEPPTLEELVHITETSSDTEASSFDITGSDTQATEEAETSNISIEIIENTEETYREQIVETYVNKEETIAQSSSIVDQTEHINATSQIAERFDTSILSTKEVTSTSFKGSYKELSYQLARIVIPDEVTQIGEDREYELLHPNAYLNTQKEPQETPFEHVGEDIMPSAPCFEEVPQTIQYEEVVLEHKPKVKCMALEDAIKLCGGKEMEEVRAMSEREEEIVEAGPMSGPEHPLVDLLSTFRSSLIAVERERIQLACGFAEEEKRRGSLWKIEKRHVNLSEKCPCGLDVHLKASYEHAELVKEKLPVAKLRLESLLRDVQDSYCHHQHAALLAHCQIEELISETIQSNKNVIREALSLILQALRLSDNAPLALASALQRWAAALSAALIDNRDLRQLLFLLHHLFRQSRSVQWASLVVHTNVDVASPWRVIALLSLLLARPRTDTALECTEDAEDAWEEVDKHGGGGAVSEGTLRERDLLALLLAFPLRDLVARLVLFTHSDIRHARPNEWGDTIGGRGVVKACCGVRVLLHVLQSGARAHAGYVRLHHTLRELAARALHALACLHLTSRAFYLKELEEKISAELEASFSAGFTLFEGQQLHELPATLLADNTAKDYCISIIIGLHDTSPKQLELLSIELPALPCDVRIRIVSQAAVDRAHDHELARIVLEFLLQTGLKRKSVSCKGMCDVAARECLGRVLAAHAYLHTTALHILADLNIVESLDPCSVKTLNVYKWRPSCMEIHTLLDDWARRCQPFLQHLLLELDYTPYVGLPLDVQLTIGSWLCSWVLSLTASTPEWCWSVLRRLRVHRTCWNMACDAPAPDCEPIDLFGMAYALMATSYGHCIPVICSEGVSALCKLAGARPRDAVQCLAGVMLVMAHSPESVAYTPKFTELFTCLLSSGPTLVQRALGRGGAAGSELLLRLILAQLSDESGAIPPSGVLNAWLHACWRPQLPGAACALVDAAAVATRLWPHLDAYANALLQEENAKDHLNHAVRNAATAPLLCECLLRACHAAREASTHMYPRLLSVLHQQRVARQKIHVDNALQKIGANITSEELVIYRAATAALAAPMNHPAHLTLWRLLMHLYLQIPPEFGQVPAIGPLFFSGLIKSRTLAQIKRRLLETITYHHNEGETLKTEHKSIDTSVVTQSSIRVERGTPVGGDDGFLPALSIIDLTGESSGSSDVEDNADDSRSEKESSPSSETVEMKRNLFHLIAYHAAAEKLLNEYLSWLEQGENVRVAPHFADIARYVPEHALEAAWKRAVSRPLPSLDLDSFPSVTVQPPPDNTPPQTPFHVAVNTILKIKDRSRRRRRRTLIKSPVEDVDFQDSRTLISLVDKHLNDIEKLAQEWCAEVARVSSLDSRLWELVGVLRVRRALPPVRKQCASKCKPITIYIPQTVGVSRRAARAPRAAARAQTVRQQVQAHHYLHTGTWHVTSLDSRLWELVGVLRVRRALPPVRKQCASKCKPITIYIPQTVGVSRRAARAPRAAARAQTVRQQVQAHHYLHTGTWHVTSLDSRLWELVGVLRVRRALPPVRKQCASKCKPITIYIPQTVGVSRRAARAPRAAARAQTVRQQVQAHHYLHTGTWHVTSLDSRLWELVGVLRVRRALPPVRKQCASKCKPITIYIPQTVGVSRRAARAPRAAARAQTVRQQVQAHHYLHTGTWHVTSLDSRLWELVGVLRVRRALPPVRKQCASKCKPITIYIPEQEWCISVDAERGIKENRSGARASVRRLARARPHAARTAAALHTIARRTCSSEAGVRVVERAWRVAGAPHCAACAPASSVLTALVADLAERWICHSGRLSTELLSAWGRRSGSALQQALCGALLAPRRLPHSDWPKVYTALLDSQLPSHTVFSYLSKFEMSRWSESADPAQRRDMLEALIRAVQRGGPSPAPEHHMLVELLGVHSAVLIDARELCAHVLRCATAAVNNAVPPAHWTHVVRAVDAKAAAVPFDQDMLKALIRVFARPYMLVELLGVHSAVLIDARELCAHVLRCATAAVNNAVPPAHWTHVVRAVDAKAAAVPFDQIGHLLRELGVLWWEARTGAKGGPLAPLAPHAPHVAALMHALQRAFVAAAMRLSLEPERVAWYAWGALQEAWGAWVAPHAGSPPLLPSTHDDEAYTPMLRHFVDNVHQIMLDCPGSEIHLLQQLFEWAVQLYVNVQCSNLPTAPGASAQESRVQASALLAELAKLPWSEHQWFYGKCLQQAIQESRVQASALLAELAKLPWSEHQWFYGKCLQQAIQESRVQASALLAELAKLPWSEHQWFYGKCLQQAIQESRVQASALLAELAKLPWSEHQWFYGKCLQQAIQESRVQASALLAELAKLPWSEHQWFYGKCLQQAIQESRVQASALLAELAKLPWSEHQWFYGKCLQQAIQESRVQASALLAELAKLPWSEHQWFYGKCLQQAIQESRVQASALLAELAKLPWSEHQWFYGKCLQQAIQESRVQASALLAELAKLPWSEHQWFYGKCLQQAIQESRVQASALLAELAKLPWSEHQWFYGKCLQQAIQESRVQASALLAELAKLPWSEHQWFYGKCLQQAIQESRVQASALLAELAKLPWSEHQWFYGKCLQQAIQESRVQASALLAELAKLPWSEHQWFYGKCLQQAIQESRVQASALLAELAKLPWSEHQWFYGKCLQQAIQESRVQASALLAELAKLPWSEHQWFYGKCLQQAIQESRVQASALLAELAKLPWSEHQWFYGKCLQQAIQESRVQASALLAELAKLPWSEHQWFYGKCLQQAIQESRVQASALLAELAKLPWSEHQWFYGKCLQQAIQESRVQASALLAELAKLPWSEHQWFYGKCLQQAIQESRVQASALLAELAKLPWSEHQWFYGKCLQQAIQESRVQASALLAELAKLPWSEHQWFYGKCLQQAIQESRVQASALLAELAKLPWSEHQWFYGKCLQQAIQESRVQASALLAELAKLPWSEHQWFYGKCLQQAIQESRVQASALLAELAKLPWSEHQWFYGKCLQQAIQESRVQASALLAELAKLPWSEHQWFYGKCLQQAIQESRVQASALLAELAKLPWSEHQWFYGKCLQQAIQESRVQASALLAELAKLPWSEHQWFYGKCLQQAIQESRVQASALLAELAKLPWSEHQWFYGKCLQQAIQESRVQASALLAELAKLPWSEHQWFYGKCLQQAIQESRVQASALLAELAKLPWSEHQWFYGKCLQQAIQESRVQASALLAELAKLPWSEHQWFYGKCLQQAIQMSTRTDRELTSWCCGAWRATLAATLLRDVDASSLAPRLAELLYLFTGTHLPNSQLILEEACLLPWHRLPELALDEALDRFIMLHHNPALPYHDLPQFRLILVACGLSRPESTAGTPQSGAYVRARGRGVSQWVRGACAPTLASHVPAHSKHVLHTLTDLAPHLNETEGEIEELLSRAVVIMCMEPAASVALPVWVSWVSSSPPRLVRACVSAVATLTAFEYFATLADAAVKALLKCNEGHGWREVTQRWSGCPWREAHALTQRARLHAAYACALTHAHTPSATRATLAALLSAEIHFVDNEPIIALWICYACRIAVTHSDTSEEADETRECSAAARALVARWTEQPRRSLLRVVTMHADTDKPTALHRLLCRYAQCVLSPDDNTRRAYESACSATLGANNDVASWATSPQLDKLVRLAARLWPKSEKYFQYEMEVAPAVGVVSA
ncbi:hypothetical protein PYW07_016401 [Mythimna separata]|uniref:Uncharacterized protein n=1 Tax=Mythimna separata TaxID=271217 RepID=A0AAD7YJX9_MYTSE|nr:hypothetical protein PYW07_016401 [Mythimna separata]